MPSVKVYENYRVFWNGILVGMLILLFTILFRKLNKYLNWTLIVNTLWYEIFLNKNIFNIKTLKIKFKLTN